MRQSIIILFGGLATMFAMTGSVQAQFRGQNNTSTIDSLNNSVVHSDTILAPSSLYIEFLGAGVIYTINYDRMLSNNVALRIGFGYLSISTLGSASLTAIPITLSWFPFSSETKTPASKLEIGTGFDYMNTVETPWVLFGPAAPQESATSICFTGIVGYRYQSSDGGFVFRIAFTPILFTDSHLQSLVIGGSSSMLPFGGISFGIAF